MSTQVPEHLIDPDSIAGIRRILKGSTDSKAGEFTWTSNRFDYKGVLILEVTEPEKKKPNKIVTIRFVVVGETCQTPEDPTQDNSGDRELITYRLPTGDGTETGRRGIVAIGLSSKTTTKLDGKKDMLYCSGLGSKWDVAKSRSGGGTATRQVDSCSEVSAFRKRKAHLDEICNIINVDRSWEEVEWDSVKEIIDDDERFRDLNNGNFRNTPMPAKRGGKRKLDQLNTTLPPTISQETTQVTQPPTKSQKTTFKTSPKASKPQAEAKKGGRFFDYDPLKMFQDEEVTELGSIFYRLQFQARITEQVMQRFVDLVNKSHPWHYLSYEIVESFNTHLKENGITWSILNWPAFWEWHEDARERMKEYIAESSEVAHGNDTNRPTTGQKRLPGQKRPPTDVTMLQGGQPSHGVKSTEAAKKLLLTPSLAYGMSLKPGSAEMAFFNIGRIARGEIRAPYWCRR